MGPSSARIAHNTLVLYFRQILIMLVSLYTVRVVLNTLGAQDYGIYNVAGGVVTMFGFLSGAMATASQRYFAFDLGRKDFEHLKTTFSVTFQIYGLLALAIVLLAETAGLWFVLHKLVIPPERLSAAFWIYQAAIFSFLMTLITTPYMAIIIAHENMDIYAYVSIVEAVMKLAIVYLLQTLAFDKLILYGLLLAAVSFIITAIYRFYCRIHYAECRFRFIPDKALFRELVSYSGWNLFGASIGIVLNQVTNILLNLYFNPLVNAARAIAYQVNTAVSSFSNNFNGALRPPIVKSYASGQTEDTLSLVYRSCKITFFLSFIVVLPFLLEMDSILGLWLQNPPDYATVFTRLALADALLNSISIPLMTLAQATGKIKLYQCVVGGIALLNFPLSWLALHLGAPCYSVMVVLLAIALVNSIVRLYVLRRLTVFSIGQFVRKTVCPCMVATLVSLVAPLAFHFRFSGNAVGLFLVFAVSVVSVGLSALFIGLRKPERQTIMDLVFRRLRHA